MANIYVNQVNFEFEESQTYSDILVNSGSSTPTIVDKIVASYIYVNQVNLEIPVSEVAAEVITNSGENTQEIVEEVIGTPVPEPEVVIGGGAGQRIRVLGGRPWSEEEVYVSALSEIVIGEEILVGELIEAHSENIPTVDSRIRKPVYARPQRTEILSFTQRKDKSISISVEHTKINSRQKEEEELLLLGII